MIIFYTVIVFLTNQFLVKYRFPFQNLHFLAQNHLALLEDPQQGIGVWRPGQEVKLAPFVLIFSQKNFKMVDPKQILVIFKSDKQKTKQTKQNQKKKKKTTTTITIQS